VQTVVETPSYLSLARKLFSEPEMSGIVAMVAADPKCGCCFRKVRVRVGNRGKSGGARVVYIYRDESFPVLLITVLAKNEKGNLTKRERNELKKRADDIFDTYRR
jgi:hypothetical protein